MSCEHCHKHVEQCGYCLSLVPKGLSDGVAEALDELATYGKDKAMTPSNQWLKCDGCGAEFTYENYLSQGGACPNCRGLSHTHITNPNDGGSNPVQYALPDDAKELQDLIEYREMNFAIGNIFKAAYRLGKCSHSDKARDLNKIIWFAQRELEREG